MSKIKNLFQTLSENKAELKKFAAKGSTNLLPEPFKGIVRDYLDSFYPSKEEELIEDLKRTTKEEFEEFRKLLKLSEIEFRNLLSSLNISISEIIENQRVLIEGQSELKNGQREIIKKIENSTEDSEKQKSRKLQIELCKHIYHLNIENERIDSDKIYVVISSAFNRCYEFFNTNLFYLKQMFKDEKYQFIKEFADKLDKLEKRRNLIFLPEELWNQEKTIWKKEELSTLIRGQIDIREKIKDLMSLSITLFENHCIET